MKQLTALDRNVVEERLRQQAAAIRISVGNLLAAGAFALVTLLPREDLMSWGWRLPFLASFLLIMVGIYVRLKVTETPVFTEAVVATCDLHSLLTETM